MLSAVDSPTQGASGDVVDELPVPLQGTRKPINLSRAKPPSRARLGGFETVCFSCDMRGRAWSCGSPVGLVPGDGGLDAECDLVTRRPRLFSTVYSRNDDRCAGGLTVYV